MNNGQNYATLTKEQLMAVCIDKDAIIESCVKSLKAQCPKMLGKKEIMDVYHCESDKALRVLKLMFQMGYGNKIGKEYYVSQKAQEDFLKNMVGKEVYIQHLKAFGTGVTITNNYHFLNMMSITSVKSMVSRMTYVES